MAVCDSRSATFRLVKWHFLSAKVPLSSNHDAKVTSFGRLMSVFVLICPYLSVFVFICLYLGAFVPKQVLTVLQSYK